MKTPTFAIPAAIVAMVLIVVVAPRLPWTVPGASLVELGSVALAGVAALACVVAVALPLVSAVQWLLRGAHVRWLPITLIVAAVLSEIGLGLAQMGSVTGILAFGFGVLTLVTLLVARRLGDRGAA